MMYLRIQSPYEAPVEAFTIMGASTSRQDDGLIGEFGTGAKHGVNVCLRHDLNPTVFCGTNRLEFFTEPMVMQGQTFRQVCVKEGRRNARPLDRVAELGAKDWKHVSDGIREFVSNAIDSNGGVLKRRDEEGKLRQVVVDVVSEVRGASGKTTVGLPLTPDVQEWYNKKEDYFLHFRTNADTQLQLKVIPKPQPTRIQLHRKGVLVHQGEDEDHPSLFDYNLGSELEIGEDRRLSHSHARDQVGYKITETKETLVRIFQELIKGNTGFWEADTAPWILTWRAENHKDVWLEAWTEAIGGGEACVCHGAGPLAMMAREKGKRVISLPLTSWYDALIKAGVPSVFNVLDNVNAKGHVFSDATVEDIRFAERIWAWIELAELHANKTMPALRIFTTPSEGSAHLFGYVLDDVVYINSEDRRNNVTYMEEFGHYITGSHDYTRDMQTFGMQIAVNLALAADL